MGVATGPPARPTTTRARTADFVTAGGGDEEEDEAAATTLPESCRSPEIHPRRDLYNAFPERRNAAESDHRADTRAATRFNPPSLIETFPRFSALLRWKNAECSRFLQSGRGGEGRGRENSYVFLLASWEVRLLCEFLRVEYRARRDEKIDQSEGRSVREESVRLIRELRRPMRRPILTEAKEEENRILRVITDM